MEIISIQPETKTSIIGRFSDGSDRKIVETTTYVVEAKESYRRYRLTFDHEPTAQEITDAIATGNYTDITTPQDVADALQAQIDTLTVMVGDIILGEV